MHAKDAFQEDFFWMLREGKGYFPWLKGDSYRLLKHLRWYGRRKCPMCHDGFPSRDLVRAVTEEDVSENPLFDLVMKALIRAEVRLISRFIPQRSHEERLTGNLVSEMDSALFLVRQDFRAASIKLYAVEKDVSFLYVDLSRGGKLEKLTGADLGLILVIDLPDFPFTVKTLILQAKKIQGPSAQIDRVQYETLAKHNAGECAYLFYDMDLTRRCSPLVVAHDGYHIKRQYDDCQKNGNSSFNLPFDEMRSDGHPLSLFLVSNLAYDDSIGARHGSFRDAYQALSSLIHDRSNGLNGRLAILSVGRPIQITTPHNEGLDIQV